jgi:membrane peptidoglycan carboxypeptidase
VLAFVAYVLVLIPFTPGIGDIRKAKVEQPARVLSADGKELAVFKWANREWVGLAEISPQVTAALIATEDHRFYAPRHRLLPPGRGDAAHLLGRQAGRLDAHPAARPQPLPRRDRPRPT